MSVVSVYFQLFLTSLSSFFSFMMNICIKAKSSFFSLASNWISKYPIALSIEVTYAVPSNTSSSIPRFSQYFFICWIKISLGSLSFFGLAKRMYSSLSSLRAVCRRLARKVNEYYFSSFSSFYKSYGSMKLYGGGLTLWTVVYRLCSQVILLPCLTLACVQSAEQLKYDLPHSQMKSRPFSWFLLLLFRKLSTEEGASTYSCGAYSFC